MEHVLAQANIARFAAAADSPQLAPFFAALDPVNAVADAAPGFVWRLQTAEGNATALRVFETEAEGADSGILINMSVWETVEALATYVYGEAHRAVLRRRREFFQPPQEAYSVAWWIPRGHIPDPAEAEERIRHLRAHGPTPQAFTLKVHFPPPGATEAGPVQAPDDWSCPV
jgi:Domain of unknown function (DUF3291)